MKIRILNNGLIMLVTLISVAHAQNSFWEQMNSIDKSASVFTIRASSLGFVFMTFLSNGVRVVRSSDNGDSWIEITDKLSNAVVTSFAFNSKGHTFAGADFGRGIFRSVDSGDSWESVNTGLIFNNVRYLAINGSDDIFAATDNNGLFRSENNGDSWNLTNADLSNTNVNSLLFVDNKKILAGTRHGLFLSENNGDNWSQITNVLLNTNTKILSMNNKGQVLAVTDSAHIFRSDNNGETFYSVYHDSSVSEITSLIIGGNGHIYIGTSRKGVFRSIDGGDKWEQLNNGLSSFPINDIAITKDGFVLAATSFGGVFRSKDPIRTRVDTNHTLLPSGFALSQNYPNPFNGRTNITIELPNACFISLEIYDVVGQKVESIMQGYYRQGKYQIGWTANGLSSGIYFLRFKAGEYLAIRKLVFQKN